MTPHVSFLLPTNRPQPQFSSIVIQSILDCKTDYSYEILVYSKDSPQIMDHRVKWVAEGEPCKGPLYGYNYMSILARGQYLVTMVDDHTVNNNFFSIIDFLKSDCFNDKKYRICTIKSGGRCPIPHMPPFNTDKDKEDLFKSWTTARFPAMDKETFKKLDYHIFHPDFKYSHADIYLGTYLAVNGEPAVEPTCTELREFSMLYSNKSAQEDENTCVRLMRGLEIGQKYVQ